MKGIVLIYDEGRTEEVEKKIIPELGYHLKRHLPYKQFRETVFSEGDLIVCYLSDQQLHELIETFLDKPLKIGFLPHPDMPEAKQGFGISNNLSQAIDQIVKAEDLIDVDVSHYFFGNGGASAGTKPDQGQPYHDCIRTFSWICFCSFNYMDYSFKNPQ